MEYLGSLGDLNDKEGEHHLGDTQPSPKTTEAVIVIGGVRHVQVQVQVQQPSAANQNLQLPGDDTAVLVVLEVQSAAAAADQNLQLSGDDTAVVVLEAQPAAVAANQNLQYFPGDDAAEVDDVEAQRDVLGHTYVPNQSDPIERLRLLSVSTLFCAAMIGVLFLPRDLNGVHTTYGRANLIASVGAPIVFATFSLFVSFWLPSDPVRRSNWITGLSMVNVSMLSGPLAIYWALTLAT